MTDLRRHAAVAPALRRETTDGFHDWLVLRYALSKALVTAFQGASSAQTSMDRPRAE